jgi:aerobic-type carbon monoxide dehydrogenase small subunit (CoxS/CutS family)
MAKIRLQVNGKAVIVDTDPERPLLEVLREDLGLTGSKYGCGEGQCRACTVLLDGRPAISCVLPVRSASGKRITTIEGLSSPDTLHPVQQAFVDEGAMQCGYCTPGMVLRAAALLEDNHRPSEEQIVSALNGSICRCNSYPRIVAAVRAAASLKGGRS